MKKLIFTLCITIIAVGLSLGVLASDGYRLQDTAGLLNEIEISEVESRLDEVSEKHGMDIAIITVEAVEEGLSVVDHAMNLYEGLGYGADGVMLYISMEESDWYILTSGYGITAITDAGVEYISNKFLDFLSNGSYADAFDTFIQYTDEFIIQAKTGNPYDTGNMPKEPYNLVMSLVVSIVIGAVASSTINGKWKSSLNSVERQTKATSYIKNGSLNITDSREFFLYRTIDRTEKPEKSSGSSTKESSSGNTYGGGGGKF